MLDITNRWASEVAPVRIPKVGTFAVKQQQNTTAISFVVDARTASGTGTSDTVTCVIDSTTCAPLATVSNPFASANSAAYATLSDSTDSVTVRFSKVPADKKAQQQNGPFRSTLEVFTASSNNESKPATFIVSNKKHGEVLADAHLQQLCYDKESRRVFFLVRSSPPKINTLEEFVADSSSSSAAADERKPNDSNNNSDWDVRSRYDAGEGYPQLFGTEIVYLDLPPSSEPSASPPAAGLVTQQLNKEDDKSKKNLSIVGFPCSVDNRGIFFCEYDNVVSEHLQRGLIHCFAARPCKQFAVAIPSMVKTELLLGEVVKQLTVFNHPTSSSSSNSNNKTVARVAYFEFKSTLPMGRRPHLGCASLCVAELDADLQVRSKRTLVDTVPTIDAEGFPGLYPVFGVGDLIWSEDGQSLLVSSVRRSAHVVYEVSCPFDFTDSDDDTPTSATVKLITPENDGAWRIAAMKGSTVVAVSSSTTRLPRVMVRKLGGDGSWKCIYEQGLIMKHSTVTKPLCSAPTQGEILISGSQQQQQQKKKKIVVFVHGGPHSTDVNTYSRSMHLLLASGYDIISVNYRGSLGFGQRAVDSLLGRVGTQDISDVLSAVNAEVQAADVQEADVFIAGGSHGGFLSCHLAGHPSQLFTAAAIRNPVTDIGAMALSTDIEDWCLAEVGVPAGKDSTSPAARMLMDRASPMQNAGSVKIPILLGIGGNDLRVPPTQGRAWARAVRQNGPEVCLIEYPADSHGLETPTTEAEFAIQTVAFFDRAIGKKQQK